MFYIFYGFEAEEVLAVDAVELAGWYDGTDMIEGLLYKIFLSIKGVDGGHFQFDIKISDVVYRYGGIPVVPEYEEAGLAGYGGAKELFELMYFLKGGGECSLCKRFQYIIHSIGPKTLQGKFIIRGTEYDGGAYLRFFKDIKAYPIGQLYIHKYEVGLCVGGEPCHGAFDALQGSGDAGTR